MQVTITHLIKDYGKFRALDDVSLTLDKGMFGLLGPNGAGKTTLMKILTTLLPLTSGQVKISGIDVMRDPSGVRRLLGYMPQDFGFYRGLNAYEVMDYIASMKGVPPAKRKATIERLLEQVNLTDAAKRRVGGYSGGMKQRLGIAQAMLGDPQLLIVDEPTAGLDPEERIRFRNLLTQLAGDRTVILSTHIVGDIEASCTALAVLSQGRLMFSGTPDELARRAQGRVWEVEVAQRDWGAVERQYKVIASRSFGSTLIVRLLADTMAGGKPVEAGIEEGYMALRESLAQTGQAS